MEITFIERTSGDVKQFGYLKENCGIFKPGCMNNSFLVLELIPCSLQKAAMAET